MFVSSRQQTAEPQSQTDPLPHATLPLAVRAVAPGPGRDLGDEGSMFVPSRENTPAESTVLGMQPHPMPPLDFSMWRNPAPPPVPNLRPQPQPQPEQQPEPAPTPVPAPAQPSAPTPQPEPEPEANLAAPARPSEEPEAATRDDTPDSLENLGELLNRVNADVLLETGAAQSSPSEIQPDQNASPSTARGSPQKRQRTNNDRLTALIEGYTQPERTAKRQKTTAKKPAGKQTRGRKRGRESTPHPEADEAGEPFHGGDDEGSDGEDMNLNLQQWMQQTQRANIGLQNREQGERNPRGRRGRDPTPDPNSRRSHGINFVFDPRKLEMPVRGDFISGYGRADARMFKWGPEQEAASTGGRTPLRAPFPFVGDPCDDTQDLDGPRVRKRRKAQPRTSTPRTPSSEPPAAPAIPVNNPNSAVRPGSDSHEDVEMVDVKPPSLLCFSPEIRENIFRHLLRANKPILVHEKWTKVCRLVRPRNGGGDEPTKLDLHPAILSTCKLFHQEAVGILYGENVFRYRMRDLLAEPVANSPGPAHGQDVTLEAGALDDPEDDGDAANDPDYVDNEEQVSGRSRSRRNRRENRLINIERYYHLFRYIAVEIEQNRTCPAVMESVANAIKVFSDRVKFARSKNRHCRQSNIHTFKVIINPKIKDTEGYLTLVSFFEKSSPVIGALLALMPQYIHVEIMSTFLNQKEKHRRLVIDQRPRRMHIRAQIQGADELMDRVMEKTLSESFNVSSKVMSELDTHINTFCEKFAANQDPLQSPYIWFVPGIEDDEYDHFLEEGTPVPE